MTWVKASPPPKPTPFDLDKFRERQELVLKETNRAQREEALDKAMELAFDAHEEDANAKRTKLAKEALEISPFCTEAYNILADCGYRVQDSLKIFEFGAQAARLFYGDKFFKENAGFFWLILETRPFMRALDGMVNCLIELDEKDKAIEVCDEMLELCPNDNLGVRDTLLMLLIEKGKYEKARELYKKYEEDFSAHWLYGKVLLDFIKDGPGESAEKSLKIAKKENGKFAKYITGKKKLPNYYIPFYSPGSEDEAILMSELQIPAWKAVNGAIEWLTERTRKARKKKGEEDKEKE